MHPPGAIRAATSFEQRIVAFRSSSISASSLRSAGHAAAAPVRTSAPALLTQTSTEPSAAQAASTSAAQPSAVERSARSGVPGSARAAASERQ
jgi:hypothetical protein